MFSLQELEEIAKNNQNPTNRLLAHLILETRKIHVGLGILADAMKRAEEVRNPLRKANENPHQHRR